MGLTLFAYVIGLATMIMGSYIRDRYQLTTASRFVFVTCLGLGLMAVLHSIALDLAAWTNQSIPLALYKAGTVALALGAVNFLRLAFSYPYESKSRAFGALLWIVVAATAWACFFNDWLVVGIEREGSQAVVTRGPYYMAFTISSWSVFLLGAVVLATRTLVMKSRIYRLQAAIIAISALICAGMGFAFQTAIQDLAPIAYPLIAVAGLLYMLSVYWAISITKLFDFKEVLGRTLAMVVFSVLIGVPVGAGAAFLLMRWDVSPVIPLAGVPLLFALAAPLFSLLAERFFKVFNLRGAYLELLEKGLSEVDFSQGRGIVFERLSQLLRESMNFSDFSIMIEDAEGDLQVAHSNCGAKLKVERKTSPFDFVINMRADVILKTEAVTNRNYYTVKTQLLTIFDALKAEAMVILREGHHVIGLIGMGAKRSGGEYTTYDANVMRTVYAKLFAIGFYLKNIAKESILTTVDRELQYSTQIISSIQENIDRIAHPNVDLAYVSKSTRKLGGDFIDCVKLSADRWFFIVGDVSGKGLNASMSMVILKSTIRIFLKEEKDFSRLVVKANAFIKDNLPKGTFFAGIIGLFDFSKDTLYFVNCGIPAMFMFSPQFNNVMEVQGEGRILGFVKDYAPYLRLRKIALQKGSTLFITTDGIIESESVRGERYGKERVQRSVSEYRQYNAETMVQLSYSALQAFVSGEINDDVTIMALKYKAD